MIKPSFKYITQSRFRAVLETDYQEMLICFNAESWKAVHVLAGSIIEAVLVDALIAEGLVTEKKGLSLELGNAIERCENSSIISERTAQLCTVIKGYRNLIHPGRVVRMDEKVDGDSAAVAKALVGMVLSEVEESRTEKYGYTAEQIIQKIRSDSSVDTILPHLLKQTNQEERARLVLEKIPEAYLEIKMEFDFLDDEWQVRKMLKKCYCHLYPELSEDVKCRLVERFSRIIREESKELIDDYGDTFFRAHALRWASQADLQLIKDYLLGRLEREPHTGVLEQLDGIGSYLSVNEAPSFVKVLLEVVMRQVGASDAARKVLVGEHWEAKNGGFFRGAPDNGAVADKIEERLNLYADYFRAGKKERHAELVESILDEIRPADNDEDIPF